MKEKLVRLHFRSIFILKLTFLGAQSFLIQGEYILNDMYRMFYHEEEIPSRVTEAKQALRITVMIKRKIISFVGKYSRLVKIHTLSLVARAADKNFGPLSAVPLASSP